MFGKPLSALIADDIHRLCEEQVRESDVVEFKRELSANKGRHRWYEGGDQVGDQARDAIANEVMAFANAHGGTLVLGIEETADKPARAKEVMLVPRCGELARRLAQMLGDIVEPPLSPFPTIIPVSIEGDAGVVVFQVLQSRNAPHRHRQSRHSYVRRGEEAVSMTMREIQDLTLQIERGLAAIERRFENRATLAGNWTPKFAALTLRSTCLPLSPIDLPGVPGNSAIFPNMHQVLGRFPNGSQVTAQFPGSLGRWKPIVRGVLTEERSDRDGFRVELQRTGLVEFQFAVQSFEGLKVFATWVMGLACNSLLAIERARRHAGMPTTEYGLELEISVRQDRLAVGAYDDGGSWGSIEPPGCALPRYSVGDPSTFDELLRLIQQDFWHAAGRHPSDREYVKFDLAPYIQG